MPVSFFYAHRHVHWSGSILFALNSQGTIFVITVKAQNRESTKYMTQETGYIFLER